MDEAISLTDVRKSFPKTGGYKDILTFWRRRRVHALLGVSLSVPKGGSFGLLGPNGAGKTTLLKILAGLMLANSGRVVIGNVDVTRDTRLGRSSLMYISGEDRTHYMRLSGWQNLDFYADLFDIPVKEKSRRINELLDLVGLKEKSSEKVIKYSTGMKQRLSIARGLLANPDILLLDEPTRSLDPVGARDIWTFIRDDLVDRQNKTVVLATHNMEEAAYLCQRVAIIAGGRIVANETVQVLRDSYARGNHYAALFVGADDGITRDLSGISGLSVTKPVERGSNGEFSVQFLLDSPLTRMPAVLDALAKYGSSFVELRREQPGLGDVVAELSGGTK